MLYVFVFFKQKTAYEMRISDWSSDVCSSDLLGNLDRREMGRWRNNRAENSHLPSRRRERAMLRFRQMKSLQKFASVHAQVHNHFNSEIGRASCRESVCQYV